MIVLVPQKHFDLFLTHVEIVFLGTPYFSATSLFKKPFFRSLKAWHFSPKLFTLSFRLTEGMLLPEQCSKKENKQTSKQSFANAATCILMPEMIHSNT